MALSRFLKTLKQSVRGLRWYLALSEARWAYQDAWVHFRQRRAEQACVSLRAPGRDPAGAVLLSYVIDPFLYPELAQWAGHTNYWESLQIARTWLELGYDVDVIAHSNRSFRPQREYTALIDARYNLERLAPLLPPHCLRLYHGDTAHVLFWNLTEG